MNPGWKLSLWTIGLHINFWNCSRPYQLEVKQSETRLKLNTRVCSYCVLWKGSLIKDQPPSARRLIGSSQIHTSYCGLGFYRPSSGEQGQRGVSCCIRRGSGWLSLRHHITLTRHWVRSCTKLVLEENSAQVEGLQKINASWWADYLALQNVPLCFFFFFCHSFHPIHKKK